MRKVSIESKIVVPYQASLFEEYLEKRLAEAGYPLSEAEFDLTSDGIQIIRATQKNKLGDDIVYFANHEGNYRDLEHRVIVDKRLLERLSQYPDMIHFFVGRNSSIHFFKEEGKEGYLVQRNEWRMEREDGIPIGTLDFERSEDKEFIDKVVKAFASVKYKIRKI